MLRYVEWQVRFKFILLRLVSRYLSFDEVNLSVWRGKLVWVDVFIVAKELVELFCEVFRGVVHVDLHLVLVFVVHSERENESKLFSGP